MLEQTVLTTHKNQDIIQNINPRISSIGCSLFSISLVDFYSHFQKNELKSQIKRLPASRLSNLKFQQEKFRINNLMACSYEKNCYDLKSFSLNFPKVNKKEFSDLAIIFKEFKSLEHLTYKFDPQTIISKGTWHLLRNICCFTFLFSLSLEFVGQNLNNSFLSCISKPLKLLAGLRKLRILFHIFYTDPRITPLGIQQITKAIKNLPLKTYDIGFPFFVVYENTSLDFMKSLSKLKNLETLKLNLRECVLFENYFTSLSEFFVNFKLLKALVLDFSYLYQISKAGWKILSSTLKKLNSLHSFTLKLRYCPDATDKAADLILTEIGQMSKLKELGIDFSFDYHLSDITLIKISNILQSLNDLSKFTLAFQRSPKFTENGNKILFESLKKGKKLKNIELSFDKCKINDEAISKFKDSIENLEELGRITLDFSRNKQINQKSISQLIESIINLKKLIILDINFSKCKYLPKKYIKELAKFIKVKRNCFNNQITVEKKRLVYDNSIK